MPKPTTPKPTLAIGSVCVWYPNADRGAGKRAAQVTGPAQENPDGVLNLAVFPDQSAVIIPVKGCRHIDDPYLKDHPQNAQSRGGWDFVLPRKQASAKEAEKTVEPNRAKFAEQVGKQNK